MRYLELSVLAVTGAVILIAMGTACSSASSTPTPSESSPVTVTNVRVLTPTPTPTPSLSNVPTPERSLGDVARGQSLFAQQCAACHGSGGEGGFAPALNTDEFEQEFADDATLRELVRTGRDGMPAFASDRLTDQELADLVAYLRSLSR